MPTTEVVHLSLLQLQLFTPTLAHKAYSRVGRESTTQQLCKDDLNSPTQNLCRATYITDLRAFSIHSNPHRIGLNILPLANLDVFLCPFKSFPQVSHENFLFSEWELIWTFKKEDCQIHLKIYWWDPKADFTPYSLSFDRNPCCKLDRNVSPPTEYSIRKQYKEGYLPMPPTPADGSSQHDSQVEWVREL